MELIFFATENCYKTRRIDPYALDSSVSLLNRSLESIVKKRKEVSIYTRATNLRNIDLDNKKYQTGHMHCLCIL